MRASLRSVLPLLLFAALLRGAAPASAEESAPGNAMCPVMTDEAIDPEVWVDHEGRRVYLCCRMCQRKFERDPSAFLANLPPLPEAAQSSPPPAAESKPEAAPADRNAGAKEWVDSLGVEPSDAGSGRLAVFVGKFHPVAAHFPIALILAAALAELLSLLRPSWKTPREGVRFCLLLGAPAAIVAAALGWIRAGEWQDPSDKLFILHRLLGTLTAIVAVAALTLGEKARRREPALAKGLTLGYRGALLAAALLVGFSGHLGGLLLYGANYFSF